MPSLPHWYTLPALLVVVIALRGRFDDIVRPTRAQLALVAPREFLRRVLQEAWLRPEQAAALQQAADALGAIPSLPPAPSFLHPASGTCPTAFSHSCTNRARSLLSLSHSFIA
jgi:hypothetical protein